MELWSRGIYGIQNFPLTGMGMNTFRKVMPVLYPTFLTSPDFDVAHAHNHLLQAGLDLGIPGLVAYISIWMVASALLVAVYRRSKDRVYTIVAGGLGIGLIAHFVFSMTDAIGLGTKVGILFWLTLALVTALHHLALPPTVRT
jgi:O-antigen ligase